MKDSKEREQGAVKAKKRLPKTVLWAIIAVAIVIAIIAGVLIGKSVSQNPAEKVFNKYLSALAEVDTENTDENYLIDKLEDIAKVVAPKDTPAYQAVTGKTMEEIKHDVGIAKNVSGVSFKENFRSDNTISLTINIVTDYSGAEARKDLKISFEKVGGKWYLGGYVSLVSGGAGQTDPDTRYTEIKGGYELTHVNNSDCVNAFEIPETYEGKPVISVGYGAFEDCTGLTEIKVAGNNLKTIGNNAFAGCTKLKKVSLNAAIEEIGEAAFKNCTELTTVTIDGVEGSTDGTASIPSTMSIVPQELFYNCAKITAFNFTDNITAISAYAFYGNGFANSDAALVIPDTVRIVDDYAFAACAKLVSVKLPVTINRLGAHVFAECRELKTVRLPSNITVLKEGFFRAAQTGGASALKTVYYELDGKEVKEENAVMLPPSITKIRDEAFYRTAIEKIVLPETLLEIGIRAFYGNSNLRQADLPANVRLIGKESFYNCEKLYALTLPASLKGIGASAYIGCTALRTVMVNCDPSIPVSTANNTYAFAMEDSIPKFYVQDENLTAFRRNTAWNTLDIYSQNIISGEFAIENNMLVQYLGDGENVTIPETITAIGTGAFAHTATIKNVTIPDSVVSIGVDAFKDCDNLVYRDLSSSGSVSDVNCLGKWLISASRVGSELVLPSDLVGIADSALINGTFRTATIPASVKYIGKNAFQQCSAMTGVNFADNSALEVIDNQAFYGCGALVNFDLPASVKNIGSQAFDSCNALRVFRMNFDGNVAIGENVFPVLNDTLKIYIKGYWVKGSLTETTTITPEVNEGEGTEASDAVTTSYLVYAESNFKPFYREGNWKRYNNMMYDIAVIDGDFAVMTARETDVNGHIVGEANKKIFIQYLGSSSIVTLPSDIEIVGRGAFAYSNVSDVNIGADVEKIERNAFYGSGMLTKVVIEATQLMYIGEYAFSSCDQLATVEISAAAPATGFTMAAGAFDEGSGFEIIVSNPDAYKNNEYWAVYKDQILGKDAE